MLFSNVYEKFIFNNAIIKRDRFQYQLVEIKDPNIDKKIVLITAFLNDGRTEKFWQDYNETLFTIDDIQALNWEIVASK
jgi:hypothetical protein